MKPRGRPRKDGAKAAWVLYRAMVGLRGYDKARSSGEKYQEALKGAVAEVRHQFPGMPISETEIKRILAEFRSKELNSHFSLPSLRTRQLLMAENVGRLGRSALVRCRIIHATTPTRIDRNRGLRSNGTVAEVVTVPSLRIRAVIPWICLD